MSTPDPVQLQAIVDAVAPGARLTAHGPLTGGVSASLTALSFTGPDGAVDRVVVRRHPAEKDPSGERITREFHLMCTLADRGLPVPKPMFHNPFLVMPFVEGTTVLPEPLSASRAMAEMLARIHELTGFEWHSLPFRSDPVPELLGWLDGLPDRAAVGAALSDFRPYAGPARLLHGDFWPGNVLWQGGKIAAVIDWEDSAIGDPLSDVACTRVELLCAAGADAMRTFTDRYSEIASVDSERLAVWDLYVSSAALTFMGAWGLPAEILASRRAQTSAFQTRAAVQVCTSTSVEPR